MEHCSALVEKRRRREADVAEPVSPFGSRDPVSLFEASGEEVALEAADR